MESLYDYTVSFTYNTGKITINLYPFLFNQGRTISRVRKLLKIMNKAYDMEPSKDVVIKQIKDFIGQYIDLYPQQKKYDSVYILSLEDKIRYAERELEKAEHERDRIRFVRDRVRSDKENVKHYIRKRKVNPKWEQLNEQHKYLNGELRKFNGMVKNRRAELLGLRYDLKCKTCTFACLEKDKIFLEQVLQLIG